MRRVRRIALQIVAPTLLALAGCAELSQSITALVAPRPPVENPLLVPTGDFEAVWFACVKALNQHFIIAYENRLSRKIVTQPKLGGTLLEPWEGDSVTLEQRFESTLQTIRRHAVVTVNPAPGGGFLVEVQVIKELEDLVKPEKAQTGRAVFNNDFPVNRSREIVGPVPAPIQYINRGRDNDLESKILRRIREGLFL